MSDAIRFALDGELTIYRAAELREALLGALAAAPELPASPSSTSMVIDLADVTEIDSAGVQLLIATQRAGAALGVPVAFADASPAVHEVLGLFHLSAELGLSA